MKAMRSAVALVAIGLLGGGYLASQAAVMSGRASEFALRMDQPQIRILAALMAFGAVILAFVEDPR